MHLFVTGTDTGVGKTWFTGWLVRAWRRAGHNAVALKPLATGDREDAAALRQAMDARLSLDEINPLYFREPAAPMVSAAAEGRTIDFSQLNAHIRATCGRFSHVAVEGVGGWRVPLGPRYEVRNWARDLGLPVIVVARAGLGTLNHTLLTVESIRAAGVTCAGVVLNFGAPEWIETSELTRRTNPAVLQNLLGLPVFELHRAPETAGQVPVWLGGE